MELSHYGSECTASCQCEVMLSLKRAPQWPWSQRGSALMQHLGDCNFTYSAVGNKLLDIQRKFDIYQRQVVNENFT